MSQKLRAEDVLEMEHKMLARTDFWEWTDKNAEKKLAYINGVHDALDAIIREIEKREES